MKKEKHVGILTFPHSPSFGASLQMTALYTVLKNEGYRVDIINYMNSYMKEEKHISGNKKNKFKRFVLKCMALPSSIRFRIFEKNLTYFPQKTIHDPAELKSVEKVFDKIVCGSDQVWNPAITGNDISYFLNFCDKKKRVAYAPSFGVTELSEPIRSQVANELKLFSGLSVREKQGQELIFDMLGESCSVVIDPTMLLDADFWDTQAKKPQVLKKGQRYIANFIFHPSVRTQKFIENLKEHSRCKELRYTWSPKELLVNRSCVGQFGPKEWLWYIKNADYIVTDSFHGCVFSILFGKKFFVSMNANANSRLKNLLQEFGLEDRIINESESCDFESKINYEKVGLVRTQRAEECLKYLLDSLKKED